MLSTPIQKFRGPRKTEIRDGISRSRSRIRTKGNVNSNPGNPDILKKNKEYKKKEKPF